MLNKDSLKWMQQGLQYHKANELKQAQHCYLKSLEAQHANYETMQLLGALLHKTKAHDQAIEYLEQSLVLSPKQAHVCNNLANAYLATSRTDEAITFYQRGIAIKPDYLDPYLNLFKVLLSNNDLIAANEVLNQADKYFPQHWRLLYLKAQLLRHQGDYQTSIEYLKQAQQQSSNNYLILHDLALTYRLSAKSAQAIVIYKQVESLGHRSEAFYHNYANALSDVSDTELALENYSKALNINPFARETLKNWCDLMWESGKGSHMFAAYQNAIHMEGAPVEVYLDYIQKLLRTQQVNTVNDVFEKMCASYASSVYTTIAEVGIKRLQNNYEYKHEKLNTVLHDPTVDLHYKLEVIEYILESNQTEFVYENLERLRILYPDDQYLLALLHTCSRILPEREYPFADVERYLFEYQIAPPGQMSLDEYLSTLKEYLLSLHTAKAQPLEQTVQNGTQTRGSLFDIDHSLLNHIKEQYILAVQAYKSELAHLPALYDGFWQDKGVAFSGSWSVALKQSGFHNNHFHPMGWLSSACYISLPDITDQSNQGYFQIGIPNLKAGGEDGLGISALRQVKPEPGKLVLFPSFLWHGTVPFEDKALRLSIACDIIYAEN